ncbi:ureidoglycolate lyase [Paraburkholderia caballeronis]|uniref:Ureidoglycolate lyase n=1 Tax=Paraburkholderia caballeronis TaxID=416943 RepID=A0A1H7FHW3_9BURK|nr:ureidoglycolate lyase [Paraburkholderia caballeronis]PXW24982.1 ureidoglycolate lyase [Paraburkholderia caballeronis]PXX00712.1 ureidoglycolate lyase [Paraburkholderia caballeronis]RAJ98775.1 ureidoglycolate lyase [Paraburkholderia caballeronis]TDV16408.1 ureidoglycolate lyase [Paraburkholderia caballeronis]TDV18804.1 ureidoglycolate lyase [Paraburkholderia caballeronis]
MQDSEALTLIPGPLTAEAFAPFGDVVPIANDERRNHFRFAFEAASEAREPALWVSYPSKVAGDVVEVLKLERHPHAAQTFIPIRDGRYLVVVCHAAADGSPDLSTLRALVAESNQGVTYRRNVWHHGLTVLDQRTRFAVVTTLSGDGDDDCFYELPKPVRIRLSAADTGA